MLTFASVTALLRRVPGIAWVVVFVLAFAAAAGYGLIRLGARHEAVKITRAARHDSLTSIDSLLVPIVRADNRATHVAAAARAEVQVHRLERAKPEHRVQLLSDTTLTVTTAAGGDSVVSVPVRVIQRIRADSAQIVADSLALSADSVKFATIAARASLDSAKTVLETRIADDRAEHDPGGLSVGKIVKVVAIAGTVVEVARWTVKLLHR
jgi:hypothetical protein